MKRYELYYFTDEEMQGDPVFMEFSTKKEMFQYYEKHKNDANKFNWFLSKRGRDWEIVEEYCL